MDPTAGGCRRSSPQLPAADRIDGIEEHEDVEGEVVPDGGQEHELDDDREQDDDPPGQTGGEPEAEDHGANVAQGVDDAVAEVVEGRGVGAVAVDDEGRVLEDLPAALGGDGDEAARAEGEAPGGEPEDPVEAEAVEDVGERVGVGE